EPLRETSDLEAEHLGRIAVEVAADLESRRLVPPSIRHRRAHARYDMRPSWSFFITILTLRAPRKLLVMRSSRACLNCVNFASNSANSLDSIAVSGAAISITATTFSSGLGVGILEAAMGVLLRPAEPASHVVGCRGRASRTPSKKVS